MLSVWSHLKFCCLANLVNQFNSQPNDKILDWFKLKACVKDKLLSNMN